MGTRANGKTHVSLSKDSGDNSRLVYETIRRRRNSQRSFVLRMYRARLSLNVNESLVRVQQDYRNETRKL